MTLRTHRLRIAARVLHRARQIADLNGSRDVWLHCDDESEGWYACSSCGADCDPYTEAQCWHCHEYI